MTTTPQIRVLKFGSSVLRSEADLPRAVHEIYREWRAGNPVVAVVSALGSTTDDLLKRAEQLGLPPQPGAFAALLATGEATAAALLTLALDRAGIPGLLLDPHQAGLLTSGAGRWPTAEAVLADLYDLAAGRRRNPGEAPELEEGVA